MAGSASKERNGRKMSMVVAKDKVIRGHKARARIWRDRGGGLVNYHHVPRSPPTVVPLSFLLFCPCRPALSHAIFRQHRHHILPHSPTQGIHHRRASGGVGFHMVNTDVRYKTPSNSFLTPRLSHLLVSRPSRSRALECFVMDFSHRSTHVAMLVCSPIVLIPL
jgi:hypothetical protein